MQRLHSENPDDVLIVQRNFPLSFHQNAEAAARAAEAAALQGRYEEMSDELFNNQNLWAGLADPTSTFEGFATNIGLDLDQFRDDLNGAEVNQKLAADAASVNVLGITGTPTVFLNGNLIANPGTFAQLQAELDAAIQDAESNLPGTVNVIASNGSATIEAIPSAGFEGEFPVRIGVKDDRVGTDINDFAFANVSVRFLTNQRPTASSRTLNVNEGVARNIALSGDDGDPTLEQALTFRIVDQPSNGFISNFDRNTGQLTYTPNPGFNGSDGFSFRVQDDGGTGGDGRDISSKATVTLNVGDLSEPNQRPNADSQTVTIDEGTDQLITLSGDDGDQALDQALTFEIVDNPNNGNLRGFAANSGQVTYRPNPGFSGRDSFTFRVVDDGGGNDTSTVATVTVEVEPRADNGNNPGTDPPDRIPKLHQGCLSVKGTDGNDAISVNLNGNAVDVIINGSAAESFSLGSVTRIKIWGYDGDDRIDVDEALAVPSAIRGGPGDDAIESGSGDDVIRGGRGDDTISSARGNDTVRGKTGNDMINGGPGNDLIRGGQGDDRLEGEDGADSIVGGGGNDSIRGGNQDDEIHGDAQKAGQDGDDAIDAGPGADRVRGGKGADSISAGAGNDEIHGGAGGDILDGNEGADLVRGGSGGDVFVPDGSDTHLDFDDREDRQEEIENLLDELLS